jgi:O-antigen/teichoic acid export membrane protein
VPTGERPPSAVFAPQKRRRFAEWTKLRSLSANLGPRRRYAIASLAGQLIFGLLLFAGSVLIARLVGPHGKGEYTAWTLGTVTLAIALAGSIPTGLGRSYLDAERAPLLAVAVRHGVLALTLVAIAVVPAILFDVDAEALIFCILIAVPASVVANDLLVVMQAAKRAWSYQAIRIVRAAVVTGGLAVAAVSGAANALGLAFGLWAAGSVVSAFAAGLIAYRQLGTRWPPGPLRRFARRGGKSYFANLIDFLVFRVDQFIVIAITGPIGLGLYSVAVNWSEVCQYLGISIGQAVFEDERTLDRDAARRILRRAFWIVSLGSIPIAVAGFLLIAPLFGEGFEQAKWSLLLLVPGVIGKGVAEPAKQILLARGAGRVMSRIMASIFGVGLVIWGALTYLLGVEGAAAATSVVYLMQMALTLRALFPQPGRGLAGGRRPSDEDRR